MMCLRYQSTKRWGKTLTPSTEDWSIDFFFFFGLFRAASSAYGDSQARGQIRAVAAGLHHSYSKAGSETHLQPTHHSSQQRWILNPLSEGRNRTCVFTDASQICFR